MRAYALDRRGATLVEILLAIFVFALAGSGILGTYLSAQYLTEHAHQTSVALDDLRDIMERIHATAFANIQDDFPDATADGGLANDYAAIVGGYTLEGQQITVTYPNATAQRLEIVATLTWTQRSRARSINLSTVRTSS